MFSKDKGYLVCWPFKGPSLANNFVEQLYHVLRLLYYIYLKNKNYTIYFDAALYPYLSLFKYMSLTAHPFHRSTGELLPIYRDAYLRGDLSVQNTELVDAYLKANPAESGETFQRFHTLKAAGHQVRPVGWVQHQLHLIRTEPARFRQRVSALLAVGVLVSGAVFAANDSVTHPGISVPTMSGIETATLPEAIASEASLRAANSLTTVQGQILDENGRPLVGATILDKHNGRGVSTDAQGKYTLTVPAHQTAQLQFGYGGYGEEIVQVSGRGVQNVTLVPRTDVKKKHHWWQF